MVIDRITYSDGVLPRKRSLPSAKAANDPMTNANAVTVTATMTLLMSPRRNFSFWNTAW